MESGISQRLAAILAADVVGYSRLMAADEHATVRALDAARDIFREHIEGDSGRVVDMAGDSVLAVFPSAAAAVRAAVAAQQAIDEAGAGEAEDRRMRFRVGVNLGEIIEKSDGSVYGDGVNIAARLESLAEPGGVMLSAKVHDEVAGRVGLTFALAGEHKVKNIERPVRTYRVVADGEAAPEQAAPLALPDKPSIVVLPFENMSGDAEQEYFSDGISEDIITELSKIDWLMVTARNSTFAYKGKAQNVQRICQELGVRYVMEGSVRKAGNRVRVTAQLIQAETGQHIWAERFDRELADIFDIQDEITAAVTANVDWELRQTERQIARRKRPEDLDAWQAHQRGLWHLYNLSKRDVEGAFPYFQQSIAIAPVFAPPHAGLAECLYSQVLLAMTEQPEKTMAEAYQHAVNAVEYDDNEAYGHYILGRIQAARGEHDLAIAELRRALELNPNYGMAYSGLALNHMWAGHAEECLPMVDKALQVSPRDQFRGAFMMIKACCHYFLDEPEIGEEWARKSMTVVASDFFWSHLALALCLVAQNRLDEAREAVAKACNRRPGLSVAILLRALPNYDNEYTRRANQDYLVAGLPEE